MPLHDLFRFSFQSFVKKKIREKEEKGGKLFEKFFGEIGNIFPIVLLCNCAIPTLKRATYVAYCGQYVMFFLIP